MNKQELIGKIKSADTIYVSLAPFIKKKLILDLVKQLDEPQKVTVPQFVAEYIDFKKTYDFHVYGAMRVIEDHYDKRVQEWFYEGNIETFARAWLDGYRIEKEPKYTVKVKATKQYLSNDEIGPHFDPSFRSNFTKSDLEKLGLGWVFDCEGMEVEKVGK
jgi:hypothetical protein|nr:MAG TPA: Protein of unknown function (DUF1642) [Caudoviricetes sp.]